MMYVQIPHLPMGIFKRMLLSYLSILFLPLLIGSMLYQCSITVVKNQAIQLGLTSQSNAIIYMDGYLKEMETLAAQFYLDKDISDLRNVDPQRLNVYDMSKLLTAQRKQHAYYGNTPFDGRYFLFFNKNDVIFSQGYLTTRSDAFYEKFLNYGNLSYQEWYQEMKGLRGHGSFPLQTLRTDNRLYDAFTYLIPIRYSSDSYAILSVLFEEELINKVFHLPNETSEYLCILNQQGELVYSSEEDIQIDAAQLTDSTGYFMTDVNGQSTLAVYSTSRYNKWTYLSFFPARFLLQPVYQIRDLTIAVFLIILLVGIIGSVLLTKRTSDPIQSILTLLEQSHPKKQASDQTDDMSRIRSAVDRLIHSNQQIEQHLLEQSHILNTLFIDRILEGVVTFSQDDIQNFDEHLHRLYYTPMVLTVMVIQYTPAIEDTADYTAYIKATSLLCNTIGRQMNPTFHCSHLYHSNQLVILLGESDTSQDCVSLTETYIQNLLSILPDSFQQYIQIGVGNSCTSISDICQAYKEAVEAAYYLQQHSIPRKFFHKKDIPVTSNTFYYTVDQEKRLINNIRSGNVEEVESICDNLYIENFMENNISYTMKICFLFNLYCTAIKAETSSQTISEEMNNEFSNLTKNSHQDTDSIFSVLSQRILNLTKQYSNKKKDSSPQIGELFMQYIETHFSENTLDASQIANEFHLSEGYFSHLFKNQCGETFSNYLEQYRISKACKLLDQPEHTIAAVSNMVGYSNVYTFRRAFKRVLGILPTQYREQL